jgi:hypothetical protein
MPVVVLLLMKEASKPVSKSDSFTIQWFSKMSYDSPET